MMSASGSALFFFTGERERERVRFFGKERERVREIEERANALISVMLYFVCIDKNSGDFWNFLQLA